MPFDGAFRLIDRALGNLSRGQIIAVALLGVAVIGIPDYLIASEISLSLFYLGPVGVAAWYAGGRAGTALALVSTLSVIAGDFGDGDYFTHPLIATWTSFLHLAFMLVTTFLLVRLRGRLEIEAQLARRDPVTGVLNARALREQLQSRLDLAAREGKPITLVYLDLDDFKRINDRHGHGEGDRVLQVLARTLTESIRRTDVVARIGGDEFAVLLGAVDPSTAERVISKLRSAVRSAFDHDRSALTCSMGCVTFRAPFPAVDDAINAADSLMYEVKGRGKNAVSFRVFDGRADKLESNSAAASAP